MRTLGIAAALSLTFALPVQAAECNARDHPGMHRGDFMVFFDLGSDRLTPRARVILDELVAALEPNPDPYIVMGAETDASEDAAGGNDLRARRGEAVRSYLMAAGLGNRWLFVDASGKRPRLIPQHPQGGEEPQNRRVMILPVSALKPLQGC